MLEFHSENDFKLDDLEQLRDWISLSITKMGKQAGDLNYIFCNDDYLIKINQDYLNHDTYTDIISFDYSDKDILSGDIFISTERVEENANTFQVSFKEELRRVLIHGVLHFAGYKDKSEEESKEMRKQEDKYLAIYKTI
jgi:rRNA maturation RNase YbeY